MAWEKDLMTLPGLGTVTDFSGTTGSTNGYGSTAQYLFAVMSADEQVNVAGIADPAIGVIQTNPKWKTGQAATPVAVMTDGVSKVVCGSSTLTYGQIVGPDANGLAVARVLTSGGADAGRFACGVVIKGAASGELAVVKLFAPQKIQA